MKTYEMCWGPGGDIPHFPPPRISLRLLGRERDSAGATLALAFSRKPRLIRGGYTYGHILYRYCSIHVHTSVQTKNTCGCKFSRFTPPVSSATWLAEISSNSSVMFPNTVYKAPFSLEISQSAMFDETRSAIASLIASRHKLWVETCSKSCRLANCAAGRSRSESVSDIDINHQKREYLPGYIYWHIFTGIQRDMMFGCLDLSENDLPSCHGNLMGKMIINHQILGYLILQINPNGYESDKKVFSFACKYTDLKCHKSRWVWRQIMAPSPPF